MKKLVSISAIVAVFMLLHSCNSNSSVAAIDEAEVLHQNQDQLTQVIIYDVFTPPVASRIYVYSSLASYDIRFSDPAATSIAAKLHGFKPMPEPEKDNPIIIAWRQQRHFLL